LLAEPPTRLDTAEVVALALLVAMVLLRPVLLEAQANLLLLRGLRSLVRVAGERLRLVLVGLAAEGQAVAAVPQRAVRVLRTRVQVVQAEA